MTWLPVALEQLARTDRITQDLHEDMPFIKLGTAAGGPEADQAYHEKAAEAVRVFTKLGEQQARRAVEESIDEAATLVPS